MAALGPLDYVIGFGCSFSDLVLPAPLGMALEPLQGACCPHACSGPVLLLLSDGETEAQDGSVSPSPKATES